MGWTNNTNNDKDKNKMIMIIIFFSSCILLSNTLNAINKNLTKNVVITAKIIMRLIMMITIIKIVL